MRAMNATMQRTVVITMPATLNPSHAPFAIAWSAFDAFSSSGSVGITMVLAVMELSVSGYRSFEIAKLAGMLMMQDESKLYSVSVEHQ